VSVEETAPRSAKLPLAVDLDGTLIRGDVFFESILAFLAAQPWRVLELLCWLARGRANAKVRLAELAPVAPPDLSYDARVLAWLRDERAAGRTIVLATASDENAARAIADHLGVFDDVFASDGVTNNKSARKAERLAAAYPRGFVYAGNERADLKVWAAAREAVLVNAGGGLAQKVRAAHTVERTFSDERKPWRALITAMRPRQWAKNVLVFLPILDGQGWGDTSGLLNAWAAFFALCAGASALYLVNDAFDIAADRRHPRKRMRPFACGELAPAWGLAAALALAVAAIALGVSGGVAWLVGAYMALSAFYTLWLKRLAIVDVFALAFFYVLRVLIGAAATGFEASSWLLAFCGFFFLSMALVKRVTEIEGAPLNTRRGYLPTDAPALRVMGMASAFVSSLVLALYVQSSVALAHYSTPEFLWALPATAIFWLCRVWLLTVRGEMHDDPIVFAFRDGVSLAVGALTAAAFAAAALL
jgi:4-hydroxybenzoate polyprenyltransferase/phosphoserine phosphatase